MPDQAPAGERGKPHVLFVDDEPGIRQTLPAVLESRGFAVTTVSTVTEALQQINRSGFDILISDLNIGQPGDGFTVVSAMRRTQPAAITIILTGYPAFETALEAIRAQVDDYVVKPAPVDRLVDAIERCLQSRTERPRLIPHHRVAQIVSENRQWIMERWLARVHADKELDSISLSEVERADSIPVLLEEIAQSLATPNGMPKCLNHTAALEYGRVRRRQGYSIPDVLKEVRLLRHTLCGVVEENLLAVDISYLIRDLVAMCDCLDIQMNAAVEAYLNEVPSAA